MHAYFIVKFIHILSSTILFGTGIGTAFLAKAKKILLCSGASSVPGLSSAIIENYRARFSELELIDYAIATAQLTNQGLATAISRI